MSFGFIAFLSVCLLMYGNYKSLSKHLMSFHITMSLSNQQIITFLLKAFGTLGQIGSRTKDSLSFKAKVNFFTLTTFYQIYLCQ